MAMQYRHRRAQIKAWLRRSWRWFQARAHSRWASVWLGVFSFLDSAIPAFPFPPEVLFAAMLTAVPNRKVFYTGVITITAILGSMLPYLLGIQIAETSDVSRLEAITTAETYEQIEAQLAEAAFLPLTLAVLLPAPSIPFMVVAGTLGVPFSVYFLAIVLGRGVRFVGIALIVHYFDAYMLQRVARHANLATGIFLLLCALVAILLLV